MKTIEEIILEIERLKNFSECYCNKENKNIKYNSTGQYWFHRHSISLYKELLEWIKSNDEKGSENV